MHQVTEDFVSRAGDIFFTGELISSRQIYTLSFWEIEQYIKEV